MHKTASSLLLCYVDHHDKAYHWAERRKLENHPKTGAAQIVEIWELVKKITVPQYVMMPETLESEPIAQPGFDKPLLFTQMAWEDLLAYGVPTEWLDDVLAANEDSLLDLADHLPAKAAEALLELATGGTPRVVVPISDVACTRARDHLLVTGVDPASEFLDDFK